MLLINVLEFLARKNSPFAMPEVEHHAKPQTLMFETNDINAALRSIKSYEKWFKRRYVHADTGKGMVVEFTVVNITQLPDTVDVELLSSLNVGTLSETDSDGNH
jgi:hypothetical protein